MGDSINNQVNHGSVRVNTRASQPRSSSNADFPELLRQGLKQGLDVTHTAVRHVTRPIPGSAAISASISEAARSLGGPSGLSGSSSLASGSVGGFGSGSDDMGSLQDEMLKNNNDMLDKQLQVSQYVTGVTTRSYLIKAYFDALKTIGSNLR
jgi:hypothetical protein